MRERMAPTSPCCTMLNFLSWLNVMCSSAKKAGGCGCVDCVLVFIVIVSHRLAV